RRRTSMGLEAIEKRTIKTVYKQRYVNYGIEKKPLAKMQFERIYSKIIVECGLFINLQEFN
ncbi:hypothetical protein ILUMI_17179, partial [Ignelater luminosus]